MNATEVAALLTVAAVYDNRKFGEPEVLGWLDAIGDLRFTESRDAVVWHAGHATTYLTPALVRARVSVVRQENAMTMPALPSGLATMPDNFWTLVAKGKAENAEKWAAVRARNGRGGKGPSLGDNYGGMR